MKRNILTLTAAVTAIALITAFTALPSMAHGPQGMTNQTEASQMGGGMMGQHQGKGQMGEHRGQGQKGEHQGKGQMGEHKGDGQRQAR
ncbi:MAG: hypothetical protein ACTSV1_03505 [Alphaproteobacteria bacterium]